jgi:flagellar motor switch protein FliM
MLLQQFMGEKFGRDSIWEGHLATELWATDVDIHAVVDEQVMTLQDVLDFRVGTRFMLNATPESEIMVLCGPERLFRGRMGRRGQNVAVMIERKINKYEDG